MSAAVFVIAGPVGSGKTHALLTRYRERAAGGIGAALWIGPSERALDALRPRLIGSTGAVLAPNLFTFPDFARHVVRAAEPAARPMPELHQRLVLDGVLADLARRGDLPHFAAVADSRGFADVAFGFLTELKGQGVTPTEFSRIVRHLAGGRDGGERDKAGQVARIFARYQKRLADRRLFDREATYVRARALWAAGRAGPFARAQAVFADGFVDFTPPQLNLLAAVAGTVEEVWVTILTDGEGDDERGELFGRPLATLAKLPQCLAGRRIAVRTDGGSGFRPPPRPRGLAHVERHLFRTEVARTADADGVQVAEAPGLVGEVRMAARAVKTLLLDGTPAGEILVTARDLAPYANLVRDVFADYGVPVDVEGNDPLIRSPAIAVLLRAARLADDDFPFAATTALLRSTYLRPGWPEVEADAVVMETAEVLLRLLGEPRGREVYLRQARLWAAEPPPGLEDEAPEESRRRRKHELAKRCLPFFERFFRAWDRMPDRGGLEAFAAWLRDFAADLGLADEAERADPAAWGRFWSELDAWVAQERHLHARPPTYTPATFHRLLGTLTASVGVPRTPHGPARVRLASAEQARHSDCEYLFLLGLGERSFPDLSGCPLFDDGERQAFRGAGLDVRCAADRLPDEMLLFYQLLTRPRRGLVLSYAAVDDKGQSSLPSSFLTAVLECFTEGTVPVARQRMLIEGYDRDRPLSPAEYRVRWAATGGSGTPPDWSDDLSEHLRAAAAIVRERFRSREFSPYDGLLRSAGIVADLRERFGPDKVLSPTALEHYVACPFRFFLEEVLKLEPLEDPAEEVEHTRRGAAVHRALARLHARLKQRDAQAPTEELAGDLVAELRAAIDEYAARVSSPAAQALWRLEGERLERAAARYGLHWRSFQAAWQDHALTPRPHAFEVDFGLGGPSDPGPLVVRHGDVEVRIGGRIDRIDVAEFDDGTQGFWVIDYKTGRGKYHTAADLVTLRKLQLPLYALAVERVVSPAARPLGLAYWLVAEGGAKVALPAGRPPTAWLHAAEHWPRFREHLERWVATLAGHIRRGVFPLKPRADDCTEACPYGQSCRIAQSRSVEKDWELPLPMISPDAGARPDA
ncbi:MAG TPA: PD-(D/E)XK nuclease family protein [Gemmataceae bacterium]|jgi:ATP-dependent helicase/DNAse subunit B